MIAATELWELSDPCHNRRAGVRTRGRVMMQIRRSWNETAIDQAEKILARDVSDEALESAGGTKQAARYTLFYCTCFRPLSGPLANALYHRLRACR